MTKTKFTAALLVAALSIGGATLTAWAPTAQAESSGWEIHSRIEQAQERIERNVARGSLSRHDGERLREQLYEIRDTESRMRRDGRLDHRERAVLDRKLDRLNREISAEKRSRRDDDDRRYR